MARAARAPIFVAIYARLLRSRRLMRAPAWIYTARAGALFGSRILMPVTPGPDVDVVASGFGRKA